MKEFYSKRANAVLRYNDFPGEGIPILFIHGLGCAGSFDYPQVAAQKALQGRRCILVDLLGSGYSDRAAYLISKSAAAGVTPSWREILYSLKCPRTFIFGEKSLPDPDMSVLEAHGIQIEIVKQAGHSMAWENPQGLAEAIKNGIQDKI